MRPGARPRYHSLDMTEDMRVELEKVTPEEIKKYTDAQLLYIQTLTAGTPCFAAVHAWTKGRTGTPKG